jgi:hypothetical protein
MCFFSIPTINALDISLKTDVNLGEYCMENHDTARRLILPESHTQALPLLAPLFKHRGIDVSIEWGTGEYLSFEDISIFSSDLALTNWDSCDQAIVVDSYCHALLASQITTFLDIPILFYGPTTLQTIHELKTQTILEIGDTPLDGDIELSNQEEIMDYTIALAKQHNVTIEYLTITNPYDQGVQVENLSAFSSLLTPYHSGILGLCSNQSENIKHIVETSYQLLENAGMTLKYVCLIGDPSCVPFSIVELKLPPTWNTSDIATDTPYADLDGDRFTSEIAIGRILTNNLTDASALFDRLVHYTSYLDTTSSYPFNWQSTAWTCMVPPLVAGTLFGKLLEAILTVPLQIYSCGMSTYLACKTFKDADFRMLPIFALRQETAVAFSEQSNFIFFLGIHGHYLSVAGYRIWDIAFHPAVLFMVSCSAGRTDNITLNTSVTTKLFHQGLASFIASTRGSWGGISIDGLSDDVANRLGRLFFEQLVRNVSTGEALRQAKNIYYTDHPGPFDALDTLTVYEYVLYGDPAFNPYEPCNEGRKNVR